MFTRFSRFASREIIYVFGVGLIVLAIFVIIVYFVFTGIKQKSWKRIVFPIIGFVAFIILVYLGLSFFITSM